MFDAVYIADSSHNLVFEYLVQLYSPHFKLLIATISSEQYAELENSPELQNLPVIEINDEFFVCSRPQNGLIIYLLCSTLAVKRVNPLAPFVFIERLIEVMQGYFGSPLTPTKIDANIGTLTLLLREMLEEGIPNTTDSNNLRDLVLIKSFLSKILRTGNDLAAAASNKSLSSLSQMSLSHSNSSPSLSTDADSVPWRRSNVKYTNNEMFVDVIERISVILRPKKTRKKANFLSSQNFDSAFYSTSKFSSLSNKLVPITGAINGQIDLLSHLSGSPSLQISLNLVASLMSTAQLHRCINAENWLRSKSSLSFIPPDGHSTLLTYQVDLDSLSQKEAQALLGLLEFDCQHHMGVHQNEFEVRVITLKHQGTSRIERVQLNVYAKELRSSGSAEVDEDRNEDDSPAAINSIKAIRVTHGDFRYKGNGKGEWIIKDLAAGAQPILRACIYSKEVTNDFEERSASLSVKDFLNDASGSSQKEAFAPLFYDASFTYKGSVPSGLKVDGLKIVSNKGMGDNVKPYKGVKYTTTTGDYAIRV